MIAVTCPRCALTMKVGDEQSRSKVTCDLCGCSFLPPHRTSGHFATFSVAASRTIPCPGCGTRYKVDRKLLVRNLHCEVCEKSFPVRRSGVPVAGSVRTRLCPVCGLAYKVFADGEEELRCDLCEVSFSAEPPPPVPESPSARLRALAPGVAARTCAHCGARYVSGLGDSTCGVCSTSFDAEPPAIEARSTPSARVQCRQCGTLYRVGAGCDGEEFPCDLCGHALVVGASCEDTEPPAPSGETDVMPETPAARVVKLDEMRRLLLDLSRRNRLLNHKRGSKQTLELVGESAAEVFGQLLAGRKLDFLAREEAPPEVAERLFGSERASGQTGRFRLPELEGGGRDRRLQTAFEGGLLQSRLLHIARRAKSALLEQGYNILYLTFGMVSWPDGVKKGSTSRAPLVFVPVELRRPSVHRRHRLGPFEDEILTNPCLVELCAREFRFALPELAGDEPEALEAYFATVGETIAELPGWSFAPELHLGLFSFAKLLMYRDLDPESWPENSRLDSHPLVAVLAGLPGASLEKRVEFPDPAELDALDVSESFQILDADASQQAAIRAVKEGANVVIQGPPGTGKSQTIANALCECLAAGKTVLFVAEKAAALEVVRRRLSDVGLGDFVLELHSRKASKKSVLKDLQAALEVPLGDEPAAAADAAELARVRQELNAVRSALHEPVEPLGLSIFDVVCRCLVLADEHEPVCAMPGLDTWDEEQLRRAGELVGTLDRRLERLGDPSAGPWRGAGWTSFGLVVRQQTQQALDELSATLRALQSRGAALAETLGAPAPGRLGSARGLHAAGRTLLKTPDPGPTRLDDATWQDLDPALVAWLDKGERRKQLGPTWRPYLVPEAEEEEDWDQVLARRKAHGRSFWRFFRPSWYRDNRRLREAAADGAKALDLAGQIAALEALVESGDLRLELERAGSFAERLGGAWRGLDGNWDEYRSHCDKLVAARAAIVAANVDAARAERVVRGEKGELERAVSAAQGAVAAFERAFEAWLAALESDAQTWLGAELADADLEMLHGRLQPLFRSIEAAHDRAAYNETLARVRELELEPFLDWVLGKAGESARGHLPRVFSRHFYRLWLDRQVAAQEALRGFRGEDQNRLIERFGALDRRWIEIGRERLRRRLLELRPGLGADAPRSSKLGLLKAEMRKKTRFMPLRKLFAVAGDVVQKIKPCFMMSPISVAQFLEPGGVGFDVVIFDEASQVEPADAFGAIARGRQLMLVGDEKQLPPTSFFTKLDRETTLEDDGDDWFKAGDLESILGLGLVHLPHTCLLRWHYRSRHASLIEFSNKSFYDEGLRIFPSPHIGRDELGVSLLHLPDAVYDRGRTRTNRGEAEAVARAVLHHALSRPELTLGVAAFSMAQQSAIEDEIEGLRRRTDHPAIERFFQLHPEEPFFVKNLENVQGDERDVMYLSVGYGRDATGRVGTNFGPLNQDGGWRRLNVLVTRARRRCYVFSSILAADIDLKRTKARGVVALRDYLHYAEQGAALELERARRAPGSGFEAEVQRSLREMGWEVHTGVGNEGFAVDLAVVDPRRPGRYLLGIEGDGATYRSSPTARDRERLRSEVLGGLGWALARVWSWDWYQQPKKARDALLAQINAELKGKLVEPAPAENLLSLDIELAPEPAPEATPEEPEPDAGPEKPAGDAEPEGDAPAEPAPQPAKKPSPQPTAASDEAAEPRREVRTQALADGLSEYVPHPMLMLGDKDALYAMEPEKLAQLIHNLVYTEGPMLELEAIKTLASWFQSRATAKPKRCFKKALALLLEKDELRRRGKFLWHPSHSETRVRYRGGNCPVKDARAIPPEEYAQAIVLVLEQTFGQPEEDLLSSALHLMGYKARGSRLEEGAREGLKLLREAGRVAEDNAGFVVLAKED